MQRQTVFTDNGLPKCYRAHVVICVIVMLVLNAVPPEGSKVTGIQYNLLPCPLCTEISPDSLNLFMILWIVDDGEVPKFLAIVR